MFKYVGDVVYILQCSRGDWWYGRRFQSWYFP